VANTRSIPPLLRCNTISDTEHYATLGPPAWRPAPRNRGGGSETP